MGSILFENLKKVASLLASIKLTRNKTKEEKPERKEKEKRINTKCLIKRTRRVSLR